MSKKTNLKMACGLSSINLLLKGIGLNPTMMLALGSYSLYKVASYRYNIIPSSNIFYYPIYCSLALSIIYNAGYGALYVNFNHFSEFHMLFLITSAISICKMYVGVNMINFILEMPLKIIQIIKQPLHDQQNVDKNISHQTKLSLSLYGATIVTAAVSLTATSTNALITHPLVLIGSSIGGCLTMLSGIYCLKQHQNTNYDLKTCLHNVSIIGFSLILLPKEQVPLLNNFTPNYGLHNYISYYTVNTVTAAIITYVAIEIYDNILLGIKKWYNKCDIAQEIMS